MNSKWYGNHSKLGIIGGGQLGRMFIQSAVNFDVSVHILDGDKNAPCKDIATSFTLGSITDYDAVYQFGKSMDTITVEIENINIEALKQLQQEGKKVFPQPHILELIKDKGLQKQFYVDHNIPTAPFQFVENSDDLHTKVTFPIVQKLRTGGYDGKGVQVLKSDADLSEAFEAPSILEEMIPFAKELSVIVARNEDGQTISYPTVECEFNPKANLVEFLFAPAEIGESTEEKAQQLARKVIDQLEMVGILAVEMFLLENGELLVNEIAPRPHNSGHHTIECNYTSQFEQHMRAVLNLPLGNTEIKSPGVMINLLGEDGYTGDSIYSGLEEAMKIKGVYPHLYGKKQTKPFRKMGHLTVALPDLDEAKQVARKCLTLIKIIA